MWKFWRKEAVALLSEKLRLRLVKERGLGDQAAACLRMMQERGLYAGRQVTYFQVFDPASVPGLGAGLRRLVDLEARSILHSGHIERDGQIVLNRWANDSQP